MDLSLVLRLSFFLLDLPPQHLQEFRFQEHFFDGDKDLKDHLNNFTHSIFETYSIRDNYVIVDAFVAIKLDKIIELVVYDFELFADKLFKEEYVPVFIHIEEPVNIGPNGSAYLPPVSIFETV